MSAVPGRTPESKVGRVNLSPLRGVAPRTGIATNHVSLVTFADPWRTRGGMEENLQDRITDLESRLAHHERMAEELSSELYRQSQLIDRLMNHVRMLRDRMIEVESGPNRSPQDERPPPHY